MKRITKIKEIDLFIAHYVNDDANRKLLIERLNPDMINILIHDMQNRKDMEINVSIEWKC